MTTADEDRLAREHAVELQRLAFTTLSNAQLAGGVQLDRGMIAQAEQSIAWSLELLRARAAGDPRAWAPGATREPPDAAAAYLRDVAESDTDRSSPG